jgi:hypothetical protein
MQNQTENPITQTTQLAGGGGLGHTEALLDSKTEVKDTTPQLKFLPRSTKRLQVWAEFKNTKGQWQPFTEVGQNAKTVVALVKEGPGGIIALGLSTWALRLAAYIHNLKSKHGIDIKTIREPHDGGHHGRYVLVSELQIVAIKNPEAGLT